MSYLLTCQVCGNRFPTSHKQRKFCSLQCSYKGKVQPSDPGKRRIVQCAQCGKDFWRYMCRANPTFCSRACKQSAYKAKSRQIEKPCEQCGKVYSVDQFFVTKRNSRYCSNDCRYAATSIMRRGAGNVNYHGGPTAYRGANWPSQRRKTMQRDGYTCQICGFKSKPGKRKVDAHHIKPYREFNGDSETANHLENLITLCKPCHGKVESGKLSCPKRLF